jgi:hypothetical protein
MASHCSDEQRVPHGGLRTFHPKSTGLHAIDFRCESGHVTPEPSRDGGRGAEAGGGAADGVALLGRAARLGDRQDQRGRPRRRRRRSEITHLYIHIYRER